jgi:hypothetical protein
MNKRTTGVLFVFVVIMLMSSVACSSPRIARHLGLAFEMENDGVWGIKFFSVDKQGFFCGVKFSVGKPEGEKYDWSQDRAENFYKSEFKGYSREKYVGANIGYVYTLVRERVFVYGGLGLLRMERYREYYDDTFTKWSKDYWIEDGKQSEDRLDAVVGGHVRLRYLLLGLGYSSASSGPVLTLGLWLDRL